MIFDNEHFEALAWTEAHGRKGTPLSELTKLLECASDALTPLFADLADQKLITCSDPLNSPSITDKGLAALEPYRVRRAVFLAAGFGSRLLPLSLIHPKPLISVKGIPIIETLLDAVVSEGIPEIVIVRGYLGEQFDVLKAKYPSIRFVDNPYFDRENNISSAYLARDILRGSYVLESDLFLYNSSLIRRYEFRSNYLGRKTDYTNDWCFQVRDHIITKLMISGYNVYHMYGISYWTPEDGAKMEQDLSSFYQIPENRSRYWDEVALRDDLEHYRICVRPVVDGDILEIDTFAELQALDDSYLE